jgi:ubiquinone/menaquinone biosynthesis C-methylase UbiE
MRHFDINDPVETLHTPGDVVRWMRRQPEMFSLIRNCYWDEDRVTALRRFQQGDEFKEVLQIFQHHRVHSGSRVLDLGAGNGVVSHAFRAAGFNVVALEPDSCPIVGWHSSLDLDAASGGTVPIVPAFADAIPLASNTFDAVYCRQVLHHIPDLAAAATEIRRVLRPGGLFLATREHVVGNATELESFLSQHPVHQRVGGEHAYRLDEYLDSLSSAGFSELKRLGPYESPINYFPMSALEWEKWCRDGLSVRFGRAFASALVRLAIIRRMFGSWASNRDRTPGRLYSFLAIA